MSAYLARLKQLDNNNFINTSYDEVTKPTKAPFVTYDTLHMGHIVKNIIDETTISNWWLIHFIDSDPVQVAIWPPCNHTDALAFNPKAIAAEPLPTQVSEVINNDH